MSSRPNRKDPYTAMLAQLLSQIRKPDAITTEDPPGPSLRADPDTQMEDAATANGQINSDKASVTGLEKAQVNKRPREERDVGGRTSWSQRPQDTGAQHPAVGQNEGATQAEERLRRDARSQAVPRSSNRLLSPRSGHPRQGRDERVRSRSPRIRNPPQPPRRSPTASIIGGSTARDQETIGSLHESPGNEAREDDTFKRILSEVQALVAGQKNLMGQVNEALKAHPPGPKPTAPPNRPQAKRSAPRAPPPVWDQELDDERFPGPKMRDKTRVALQGFLRKCILEFQKRANAKAPLPPGPPDTVQTPTAKEFYLKWDEPHNSIFNVAACNIVVNKALATWEGLLGEDERDNVFDMVSGHIKYLIKLYHCQHLAADDPGEVLRHHRCSADRRKRTTSKHRMFVINTIPRLKIHRRLFLDLGVDGTSSDEEDPTHPGVYLVKQRKELSPYVNKLKRKLNAAYWVLEKGPGSKGSQVRQHVPSNLQSTRKFRVKGLPVTCMNRTWFEPLTESQRAYFKFNYTCKYNFWFPDELFERM